MSPIIIAAASFASGIIFGRLFNIPIQIIVLSLIVATLSILLILRTGSKPVYLILFTIFLFGVFAFNYSSVIPLNDVSRFAGDRFVRISGTVNDEPADSGKFLRFTLKVEGLTVRGVNYKVSGRAGVFIKDNKASIKYGNIISVYGKLSGIASSSNPGITSFGDLMAKRHINCQIFSYGNKVAVIKKSIGNPIKYISLIIKNRLMSVIQRTMSEPYSSLLGSIVFGSQASPLSEELQENYRTAGVIHLLVVSGTQVSIILSVVLGTCKLFGSSQNITLIIVSMANLLFAVMVGAGPSIIRAAVMAETALIANIFERQNDFYNSLSVSVVILLMLDPLNLFDLGFQLSFIATWALFYVAPAFEEKIKGFVPGPFSNITAISIAPTIATTPIILFNFGQISFVSIISNFLIIPWVEVTVIMGFASTMIGLILPSLAYAVNNTLTVILALLNLIVYSLASIPFACRYFSPPVFPVILVYYGMLIWGVEVLKGKLEMKFNKKTLVILLLLAVTAPAFTFCFAANKDLVVTFIDVGQGDAILVESPSGQKALIDGGGRQEKIGSKSAKKEDPVGRGIIAPFLRKKGINELNLVVLTHPHDDHVAGLPYILGKLKIDLVLDSGMPQPTNSYYRFLSIIKKKKIPYQMAKAGQEIDLGGGVKAYILHPSKPLIAGTISDLNNNSVVIRLVYGDTSFLLAGDAAFEGEGRIIASGTDIKSNVLKVGHHGSRTSTSDKFLNEVKPEYAVISVGLRNKFGHPSQETLNRLYQHGVKILRTDLNGAVRFVSDGKVCNPR